jgi:hypothetical protein
VAVTGPPPKDFDFKTRVVGGSGSPLCYPSSGSRVQVHATICVEYGSGYAALGGEIRNVDERSFHDANNSEAPAATPTIEATTRCHAGKFASAITYSP